MASPVVVDIRQFLWSRPYVSGIGARTAFVGLRYAGDAAPAATAASGCGCGCAKAAEESPTRLHDGYAIEIVWTFHPAPIQFDLCQGDPAPGPFPANGPYVILAAVRLPASENTPLSDQYIITLG